MRTALRSSNRQPISAAEAQKTDGPFFCDGCGTPVSFVNAHTKHAGEPDRERLIPSFFRLVTSRPASEHQPGCPYRTAGQIRELVANSTAVEMRLRPFTEEDGKQVFRLAMLKEAEKALPRIEDKDEYLRRRDVVRSSRELAQYFRSAAGLAKLWILLGRHGGRRELSDLVSVKLGGKVIPWRRFFYEAEDTPDFAKRLAEDPPKHPTALLVRVREAAELESGRVVARCTCELVPGSDPLTFAGPSLFGKAEAMGGIRADRHYVVVALWHRDNDTTRPSKQVGKPPVKFQNLSATIYQAAQYAEVDPPEE